MHSLSTVTHSSSHSFGRRCAQDCPQRLWKTMVEDCGRTAMRYVLLKIVFCGMMFEFACRVADVNDSDSDPASVGADTGRPSMTALTAAAARAAHLIVDGPPVIFADTLASALLGDAAEELIGYHRLPPAPPVRAGARTQAACRSRHAEDSLARAVGRGVTQYVILGAGADTFAYRSDLAGG